MIYLEMAEIERTVTRANYSRYQAMCGLRYALNTGRLPGAIHMYIERMSNEEFHQLLDEMTESGLRQNVAARWLTAKYNHLL